MNGTTIGPYRIVDQLGAGGPPPLAARLPGRELGRGSPKPEMSAR
jgi:hypothetical protein